MKIYIPWIISRRRFFFAVFLDFFITSFFYTQRYSNEYASYPNTLVTISISIFWITLSYILGRYMICRKINRSEIIKNLLKGFFLFASSNIIYLLINWSKNFFILLFGNGANVVNFQNDQNIFFIKTILLISIISGTVQFFLSILTSKLYDNKKLWLFYGSQKGFQELKKEIGIKTNLQIKKIRSNANIKKIDYELTEGVILDNNIEISKVNLDHIFYLKSKGIKVLNVLKWCENELQRIPPFLIITKYQIIEKFDLLDNSYKIRIKRIGDFTISIILILITSPLFVCIALLIFLEDRGPVFYSQVRTGYKGKKITIYKFRSMIKDAEKYGPQWSISGDKRITRVGRILRALRVDELPQLFSVIRGDMSLIGPRPERPEIEKNLLNEIPYYDYRSILKPGISGWAQVNFNYAASKEDTVKKLSYDIYYINHISFFLDLLILIKTIKIIFNSNSHRPN